MALSYDEMQQLFEQIGFKGGLFLSQTASVALL